MQKHQNWLVMNILGGSSHGELKWVSSPQLFQWINPTKIPFITGVITHLLSGMSHQVWICLEIGHPQLHWMCKAILRVVPIAEGKNGNCHGDPTLEFPRISRWGSLHNVVPPR